MQRPPSLSHNKTSKTKEESSNAMSNKNEKRPPSGKKEVALLPPPLNIKPPPKKQKPVVLAEMITTGISPVNDSYVAAPSLSEPHLYFLEKWVKASLAANPTKSSTLEGSQSPLRPSSAAMVAPLASGDFTPHTSGGKLASSILLPSPATVTLANPTPRGSPGSPSSPQRSASPPASMHKLPKRAERFVYAAENVSGNNASIPTLRSSKHWAAVQQSKQERLLQQYPIEDVALLRLMTYYKVIHNNSLRVHEEISRNLRVNIADLALVEKALFEAWDGASEMANLLGVAGLYSQQLDKSVHRASVASGPSERTSVFAQPCNQKVLPPVSILVLFLWTCDTGDVLDLFLGDDKNTVKDSKKDSASAARTLLVAKVRERVAQALLMQAEGSSGPPSPSGSSTSGKPSFEGEEDFSRGARNLTTDLRYALQNRKHEYLLNRWTGTLSVLLATLRQVHVAVNGPPREAGQGNAMQDVDGKGTTPRTQQGSQPSFSRPESGRSAKSSSSQLSSAGSELGDLSHCPNRTVLRCRLQCASAADALKMLESLATSAPEGYPIALPPLLSFTNNTSLIPPAPPTMIRRHDDFQPPMSMEVDDEGRQRSFEDRTAIACQGWYVSPKPTDPSAHPSDPTPGGNNGKKPQDGKAQAAVDSTPAKKPPTPGKKKRGGGGAAELQPITPEMEPQYLSELPKYITVEVALESPSDHCIELRQFCSHHSADGEFLFAPLTQFRVFCVIPEQLKLCLRVINHKTLMPSYTGQVVTATAAGVYPRRDQAASLAPSFFERVLSDAKKASQVASKICTRLVSQFVKPHHCHRHPQQQYRSFCHDCRIFICPACAAETHSPHHTESVSAVCHTIVQRQLQPKIQTLSKRAELLRDLLGSLDEKRRALRAIVDEGVDDVKERIMRRRALLHEDAEQRASKQKALLVAERSLCAVSLSEGEAKLRELERVRYGVVPREPIAWKPLLTHQVLDHLHPLLPTAQICSLITVLTWSNPSKYLIHVIYPPEALVSHASGHHLAIEASSAGDGGDHKELLSWEALALRRIHQREEEAKQHEGEIIPASHSIFPLSSAALGKHDWTRHYTVERRGKVTTDAFPFLGAESKRIAKTAEMRHLAAVRSQRGDMNEK